MSENCAAKKVFRYRGHPARAFGAGVALLVMAIAVLNLAGCNDDDPVRPPSQQINTLSETVTVTTEPEFTAGTTNTISWAVADDGTKSIPDGWSFLAQRSPDVSFATEVDESAWASEDHHTFSDLTDGATNYYRVMARDGQGRLSQWSATASTTQDAQVPVATVLEMIADQTSLLFDVEVVAEDATSGIAQVDLWFRENGGDLQWHGIVEPGVISFQTDVGGPHEFIAVATDAAGNVQGLPTDTQAATLVPEPIILVDSGGYEWDVTNAVLKHGIHLPWWEFGLGRFTIRPAINPYMIGPADGDWPDPQNIADVVAVNFDGDSRAYKIGDLAGREVADDVVNGEPIAVTY